jgi:predicted phosphodiesterase
VKAYDGCFIKKIHFKAERRESITLYGHKHRESISATRGKLTLPFGGWKRRKNGQTISLICDSVKEQDKMS